MKRCHMICVEQCPAGVNKLGNRITTISDIEATNLSADAFKPSRSSSLRACFIEDLLVGLRQLHAGGFVHNDVNPQNIKSSYSDTTRIDTETRAASLRRWSGENVSISARVVSLEKPLNIGYCEYETSADEFLERGRFVG